MSCWGGWGEDYNADMAIDPRRIEVIDDMIVAVLRGMSPAKRLEMANRMVVDARRMIRTILASQHPEWPTDRLEAEVRLRMRKDEQ